MERPIFKPIGSPVEELDTPALVVDLDKLESNIETAHSFFEGRASKLRPRVSIHGCPAVAHMQLAAPGTVGGVSVVTLGQAEAFSASGINDFSIGSVVVTGQKIARLCALARHASVSVVVDSMANISDLSAAASAAGVEVKVLVAIATRPDRIGVDPGQPAVDLAKAAGDSEGLTFDGFKTHEGTLDVEDVAALAEESRAWIGCALDAREAAEAAGLTVNTVSAGGTYNYEVAGSTDGVTEVPAGSYALMDGRHAGQRDGLEPAAKVLTTVTSYPEDTKIITDGGNKAIGMDRGAPVADLFPEAAIGLSAEHGNVGLEVPTQRQVNLGDVLWFTPGDMGITANLYDYMNAARDGRLEAVWELPARGRYR